MFLDLCYFAFFGFARTGHNLCNVLGSELYLAFLKFGGPQWAFQDPGFSLLEVRD